MELKLIKAREMMQAVEHAWQAGHEVVGSEARLSYCTEYLIRDNEGNAEYYRSTNRPITQLLGDGLPEIQSFVAENLRVVGVSRRRGLMRKFVECPEKLLVGDSVILEDAQGERLTTRKLTDLQSD
jgi:hypothetical protein